MRQYQEYEVNRKYVLAYEEKVYTKRVWNSFFFFFDMTTKAK